jgi:hypothetical protein
MKRCPQCLRDLYDDSLLFCVDDGTALLAEFESVMKPNDLAAARAEGERMSVKEVAVFALGETS